MKLPFTTTLKYVQKQKGLQIRLNVDHKEALLSQIQRCMGEEGENTQIYVLREFLFSLQPI